MKYRSDDEINKIVEEYEGNIAQYKEFEETLNGYLKEIIEELSKQEDPVEMGENDIEIKSRTKEPKSLKGKIIRKDYEEPLKEITDLVGAKIMLTSLRYAELVYELVKKKFSTSVIEEIDKSKILKDARKFGYLGRHIVIRCNKDMEVERFRKFDGLAAEIQIKTLLQHTWAEIEHKLRYKPQIKLDEERQRYFDRLAAMIEVADDLFKELILEWERISNKKSQRILEEINCVEKNEEMIYKDEISLLDSEAILLYLRDKRIGQKFNRLKSQVDNLLILEEAPDFIGADFISLLELAGINSVKKLGELFEKKEALKILREYVKKDGGRTCFSQINILKMLVYGQLSEKKREEAKNALLIQWNTSKLIDAIDSM